MCHLFGAPMIDIRSKAVKAEQRQQMLELERKSRLALVRVDELMYPEIVDQKLDEICREISIQLYFPGHGEK